MQVRINDAGGMIVSIGRTARILEGRSEEGLKTEETGTAGSFQSIEGAFGTHAPGIEPAAEFLQAWRAHYYHFRPLRPGTGREQALSNPRPLDPSGVNLPDVLHGLLTNDFDRWTRIRQLMEQIVPDVGQLEIRSAGPRVWVSFSDPNVPGFERNLKDLGTGVEQLLLTIVMGVTQPGPSVVLMEEPETNLHAGAQRALLGLLQEWATDRLFVVSTHSQVFLDRAPTAALLKFVRGFGMPSKSGWGCAGRSGAGSEPAGAHGFEGFDLADVAEAALEDRAEPGVAAAGAAQARCRAVEDLDRHPVQLPQQAVGDLAQVVEQLSGAERGHLGDLGPGVAGQHSKPLVADAGRVVAGAGRPAARVPHLCAGRFAGEGAAGHVQLAAEVPHGHPDAVALWVGLER